jgi:hypothetical protein
MLASEDKKKIKKKSVREADDTRPEVKPEPKVPRRLPLEINPMPKRKRKPKQMSKGELRKQNQEYLKKKQAEDVKLGEIVGGGLATLGATIASAAKGSAAACGVVATNPVLLGVGIGLMGIGAGLWWLLSG